MPQSLLDKSKLKPNQYLLTVNDVTMDDQTAIYLPQSGQLSITYTSTSKQSQMVAIYGPGTQLTPIDPGTKVYVVEFGAAIKYSGTGNGYVNFQLSWEYVG